MRLMKLSLSEPRKMTTPGRRLKQAAYMIGILAPLTCLPQIMQILETKSGEDVSAWCWGLSAAASAFWVYYAWKIKNKEFMISAVGWTAMQLITIIVALMYR